MSIWKEPHWSEGMLLLPQHLQFHQRYLDTLFDAACASMPYSWGVQSIELSETAIKSGVFEIKRCRLRTPEGTWVFVPENTDVASQKVDEALKREPDGAIVYLAVPRLQEVRPNASYEDSVSGPPMRHLIELMEIKDENTGADPRQIEAHTLRGRLLFGSERNLPGYETVPIARIHRSSAQAGAPALDPIFIPPLLRVEASATLVKWIEEITNDVAARNRELGEDAKSYNMTFRDGVFTHTERLLMLNTLNEALACLRHVLATPEERPYRVYGELCRLGGLLSVFGGDRRVLEYPRYDHEDLTAIFKFVCEDIRKLLKFINIGTVEFLPFQPRNHRLSPEGAPLGLWVTLNEKWLAENSEFYMGVHTAEYNEEGTKQLLDNIDFKVASDRDIDWVFDGGMEGLSLSLVRGLGGLLPFDPKIKYFQVQRQGMLWSGVVETRTLALRYSTSGGEQLANVKFFIYATMRG